MNNSILVTYATNFGSTQEVAETIANTLREDGHIVDVLPITAVKNLDDYHAIILGSAVNYAKWLSGAIEFIQDNQEALNRIPVALFTVHIQNTGNDPQSRQKRHAYLDDIRPLLSSISEGYFAGKFDKQSAKILLPKWISFFIPTFDLRKRDKIHAWAKELSSKLTYQLETGDQGLQLSNL